MAWVRIPPLPKLFCPRRGGGSFSPPDYRGRVGGERGRPRGATAGPGSAPRGRLGGGGLAVTVVAIEVQKVGVCAVKNVVFRLKNKIGNASFGSSAFPRSVGVTAPSTPGHCYLPCTEAAEVRSQPSRLLQNSQIHLGLLPPDPDSSRPPVSSLVPSPFASLLFMLALCFPCYRLEKVQMGGRFL